MKTLFHRVFDPGVNSLLTNLGLLTLRLWLGATLLFNHGLDKLTHFSDTAKKFPDVLHLGSPEANLALTVFAEVVCSALIALGLITRFAAMVLAINMAVAFFLVHHGVLHGEHSGELAFIYLAGYVALLLGGPGRFSFDSALFGRK